MSDSFDIEAAVSLLKKAVPMIGSEQEAVIRAHFEQNLANLFPLSSDEPAHWWIEYHAKGSEAYVQSYNQGTTKRGFVDVLVGSTAIEYEKDLTKTNLLAHGEDQVREYCAGLLNKGIPQRNIIGVLSDTVRWKAFRISEILASFLEDGGKQYGEKHLRLEELESIDLSSAGPTEASQLCRFLLKYLAREGSRLLDADTLASDLGFTSDFCGIHIDALEELVGTAFKENKEYSRLIAQVWTDFVSYLGGSGAAGEFDQNSYVGELYILTLAKLLCANVLEGKTIGSTDQSLTSVIDGTYFKSRGFTNLVEYDYFGWLNTGDNVASLLPIARGIQSDLAAYDFVSVPSEDLFGSLMAQLAERSQRLLLGQEWTPAWLAREVVESVLTRLPNGVEPRLLDMCCGSGSMIVETVKSVCNDYRENNIEPTEDSLNKISQSITGFDIDPLAVMLSKVSWILAAKDWIEGAGAFDITIPIYHADSLFASTPITQVVLQDGSDSYELNLDGHTVSLPSFLVSSEKSDLYDLILSTTYSVAMEAAGESENLDHRRISQDIVTSSTAQTKTALSNDETTSVTDFVNELVITLEELQRSGRNGIWAFILSNSYRPGLVAGSFNGLVSNPPWLAMSKVADNPYKTSLTTMADNYGVKPSGSSHLHTELATIFLLHAIDRYLSNNAHIACILPETIKSAHHHNRFRTGDYLRAATPVDFTCSEVWDVESGTFKNEAVVVTGWKRPPSSTDYFRGMVCAKSGKTKKNLFINTQGQRTAWSETENAGSNTGFFDPAPFRQGADIFPRTAVFHETERMGGRINLSRIDKASSPSAYLVNDVKKFDDLYVEAKGVSGSFVYNILLSKHLTPFSVGEAAPGILPFEKNEDGWRALSNSEIALHGAATSTVFKKTMGIMESNPGDYFDYVDTPRKKLSIQQMPVTGWLVVMGAGGKNVCSGFTNLSQINVAKIIIDQTLYWVVVPSKEEALYLCGLLNSEAINTVIREFQPRGERGERHIHKLPLGATPKFDSSDTAHNDVVAKTRLLLDDWDRYINANSSDVSPLFDPNKSLHIRRKKISDLIKTLDTYAAYADSCNALYAV